MSYNKQEERFGRATGHTLRRSPQSNHFTGQFVIMKRTNQSGRLNEDDMDHQFQDVMSDGQLQLSREIAYSLNKQKRWELPELLKESICSDREVYEDLDFKVLLVEQHLDGQGVFRPVCTGLYESKTSQPERLPSQKYAHARDLHKRSQMMNKTDHQEALRAQINKLRCSKNRGGKKINWRSVMDAMQEKMRQEEQQQEQEEEDIPQLRYEVGYGRPETKYPWRPEMKMNTFTSKRSMGTKRRHKDTTACYLEDAEIMEDTIQDDIFEEVRLHSELEAHPQDDAIDSEFIVSEHHPMPTFGEILCGLARKPKQCKKRHRNKSGSSTVQTPKKSFTSNQATSEPVRVHDKGSIVYDPDGIIYKPQPKPLPKSKVRIRRRRGKKTHAIAETPADVPAPDDNSAVESLSVVYLWVDHESLKPSRLEAEFGMAYAEAQCKPRRFAVQVCDGSTDQDSNPTNKVYALFEPLADDLTNIELGESEASQSWQSLKEGAHMRMTIYGRKDRLFIPCESLSTAFPSTGIFSVQEVMTYLQSELQKPLSMSCCNKVPSQGRTSYASFRHVSLDIPTVRAVLGWDCSFYTADKAYQDIKDSQASQPCIDHNNGDPEVMSDTCGICYESVSLTAADGQNEAAASAGVVEATVLVSCGHCFCNQCWRQYLNAGVMQGTTDITCPGYNCTAPVDPVTTMAFLSPAQFHVHYKYSRDAALARDSQRRRCPNPLCGRVAQMKGGGGGGGCLSSERGNDDDGTRTFKTATVVRCECRRLWCTECMEEGHWPASCQQAKEYRKLLKKKFGEPVNKPLITHVEVKRCPGCKTHWEKNGGCPSMICGTCDLNFCWLCLRPFTEHDYNTCRKSMTSLESVHLEFQSRSKDAILEVAFEHHKHRLWSVLRKGWIAAAKLASRSVMVHISDQMAATSGSINASVAMMAVTATLTPVDNCQPVTWARTHEHLEMMNKRVQESYEIASFCHEGNFVLEHLALLLCSLPRHQRRSKWVRAMLDLRFIVQDLEETLANLPNTKRSGVTMDKLCALVRAGKECLTRLAWSMPRWHHD